MAREEDFIGLVVAHARVTSWLQHALDPKHQTRQIQAMTELAAAIKQNEAVAEEAARAGVAPALTRMLASTAHEPLLDAIAALLSALAGAALHSPRLLTVEYPVIGALAVHEGLLGDGVGARLWGISHRFNHFLIEHRRLLHGVAVLEIGSGVGSSGITAAKLGAKTVVLTDFVYEVLKTLAKNVHANVPGGPAGQPPAEGGAAPAGDAWGSEDGFSGAESVSDEGLLFAGGSDSGRAGTPPDAAPLPWDAGNMQVRCLDWRQDYENLKADAVARVACMGRRGKPEPEPQLREDDTTSGLDAVQPAPGADPTGGGGGGAARARPRSSFEAAVQLASSPNEAAFSAFDRLSVSPAMPPTLDPAAAFPVVIGCEILYELLHAKWVAAVLRRRLQPGGKALIVGAIRDAAVYRAFEECLEVQGLRFAAERVAPLAGPGLQGLGNKEHVYEGGYRMYFIEHRAAGATWHVDRSQLAFDE